MPTLRVALKSLGQLGIEPIALYGLYRLGLTTGHYRRVEQAAKQAASGPATVRPLFALPPRSQIVLALGDEGMARLLAEADEIAAGKVRLFGGEPVPLQFGFDAALRHWTEYESGKAKVPAAGDIKFTWEPARFGWALTLGRAYYLSGDEKYAQSFWQCFEEFAAANPAGMGPNWMNGQEVAIRLMSLLWAWHFFESSAASSPDRRTQLAESMVQHAARIPPTLIYARSQNNNHLVTESAALYAAGVAFGEPKWRAAGWKWINAAVHRQISSYGEYVQHSTNYHRLMLHSVLWVDAIARNQPERWPWASVEALTRASHWLFSMLDPTSGRVPNLGANDGALILPLSTSAFEDFRPAVQAAAWAFLHAGLPAGPWDELALWLGLQPRQRTTDSDAYMAEHLRGRKSWGTLRASRFPSRLSHIDQLHFDLWRGGENIARDAGTYLYNAEPPWDNPLVSTRVHNTVTVDGADEMTRGGRFLVLDWFPAYSKTQLASDENVLGRVAAYHKGYRRLGVRHERVATVFADERWAVRDDLVFTRPGEHTFRLHWLLLDGEWAIQDKLPGLGLRVQPRNSEAFTLRVTQDGRIAQSDVRISLVRAGELLYGRRDTLPYEGWVSPTYGVKLPALSLAVELVASKSTWFMTEFVFG